MDNTEIEKLVWGCIEPAPKAMSPQDSDGYDEADVFMAVNRAVQKCMELWGKKAEAWEKLGAEVDSVYESESDEKDLYTLGELCAEAYGYL